MTLVSSMLDMETQVFLTLEYGRICRLMLYIFPFYAINMYVVSLAPLSPTSYH